MSGADAAAALMPLLESVSESIQVVRSTVRTADNYADVVAVHTSLKALYRTQNALLKVINEVCV